MNSSILQEKVAQPVKVWLDGEPSDEYVSGAKNAYEGLSRTTCKHSNDYNRGRRDQLAKLPKQIGRKRAIAWWRCRYRSQGTGWHMGDNW